VSRAVHAFRKFHFFLLLVGRIEKGLVCTRFSIFGSLLVNIPSCYDKNARKGHESNNMYVSSTFLLNVIFFLF